MGCFGKGAKKNRDVGKLEPSNRNGRGKWKSCVRMKSARVDKIREAKKEEEGEKYK